MLEPTKCAEVRRILQRYMIEVVEAYQLCPWARSARLGGEIMVEVLLGEPTEAAWLDAIDRAFGTTATRVAMIVAPELAIDPRSFHAIRDRVVAQRSKYGVAEFHPAASLDLATPARLVPFLRRSPDPLLQVVPLGLLDSVRQSSLPDRARQAQILLGLAEPPRDVVAQIALANHGTVKTEHAAIEAVLADIARDRDEAYGRVGLSACR